MTKPVPRWTYAAIVARTLAAAALGGAAFTLLALPAGWLSGAILVVAAMALAGVEVAIPKLAADAAFLAIGISLGAAITPELLHRIGGWPVTLALLLLSIPAVTAGSAMYLTRVARVDRSSAVLASLPGALSYVMATALASKADVRSIAFVQSARLFLLAVGLPGLLAATGELGQPPAALPLGTAGEMALMAACGIGLGVLFYRLRIPGGLVFGAMLASGALHGTGMLSAAVPQSAMAPCYVLLGAMIGVRFTGTDLVTVRRLGVAAIVTFAISSAIAAVFALAAALVTDVAAGQLVVAYAPGGFEAMVVLGFSLGFDPAFVATHHLVRFVSISLVLPLVSRLLERSKGKT